MIRQVFLFLTLLSAAVGTPRAVLGQANVVEFQPAGSADWGVGTNWSDYGQGQNVPEGRFDEAAVIDSGGTAVVSAVFDGASATQGPGQVTIDSGQLLIETTGAIGVVIPSGGLVNGAVVVNDQLTIQGAGSLNSSSFSVGAAGQLAIEFSAGTSSPVNVGGAASLGGTLSLDYSGFTPAGPHTLISAASSAGAFDTVDTIGLAPAQTAFISQADGLVSANVVNVPTVTVDRDTGAITIENTHAGAISLDGLAFRSGLGALDSSKFSSLGAGWTPAGSNSSTAVAQLFEGPDVSTTSDDLSGGASIQIGMAGAFQTPAPQAFQQETEDVVFEFTDPTLGGVVEGVVNYVGEKVVNNNIVLTVDSGGQAAMLNFSSFPQDIEVYRISSSTNALQPDTWNSLADQGAGDGSWSESAQSDADALLEVQEVGATTFSGSTLFNIGQILDPGFTEDGLTFEFLLAGEEQFREGVVQFGALPIVTGLDGDFNDDGFVDAADYTVWRDNLGAAEGDLLSGNGTGGVVDQADYELWRDNFGAAAASGSALTAAPEPAAAALLSVLLAGVGLRRRG